ncbi:hypothetical protein N7520_007891 [Penicillium odoratum]|uniref:uncharacterized protein n=1 Tax=Penicillium odoratum TaxID=1167516 RepID=UPI00254791CE|nr:uncharacterized protein N7520_007891 [Penicillium odoratum]KAJ5760735.1 hypothetical protein N7520_007891 [Penicillium odoratum]
MSQVQQYWLPGYGLSRHIVLGHIHYFLGPTASVRPYSYQEQIDDLATMSREYEKQEALRMTNQIQNTNGHASSRHSEPYINELIPVETSRARRHPEQETRSRR